MNRSSNWDEKSIENHLKKMPKVYDRQSKEALYEKIQERLQDGEIVKRKKKTLVIPTLATAAVLFILILMVPSFLNENDVALDEHSSEADLRMEVIEEGLPEMGIMEDMPGLTTTDKSNETAYFGAIQPSDEAEFRDDLVTIAVPAYYPTGEVVVPVTILSNGSSVLDKFLTAKETFSGERWGIGTFPPININSISEENSTVIIDVPTGSLESLSSAEMKVYSEALKETFAILGFAKIKFKSDGEEGVFWGQHGPLYELELQEPNRGIYLFESDTGHKYLVRGRAVAPPTPEEEERYENLSFQETLDLMKKSNPELGFLASIPEGVTISSIEQEDDYVTISFAEGTMLKDNEDYVAMVEAILFAAKDFGIRYVQFEGINLDSIGPYILNGVVEVPMLMNFIR